MTQVTGTYDSYDQVGIREDLSDIIYDISPIDCPFLSLAGRTEATNTLHEWQTDSLAAAAENAAIEGDDAPQDTSSATTRLNNRTQISTKDARVSGTGRAIDTAGRADELDYQVLKRGKELKRDMETSLLANTAKAAGSSSTARNLAGLPTWIATNTSAVGADPAGTGADTATDGAQRAFNESMLKEVVRETFDSGGNPDTLMLGAFNRQKASGFTGGSTSFQKAEDKVLHATFDVYESDFGMLKIIPNRFQRARDANVLEMDMWKVAFMSGRNMVQFDIAKTGDSDARQILSEYTLEACNEASSGIVRDLSTE